MSRFDDEDRYEGLLRMADRVPPHEGIEILRRLYLEGKHNTVEKAIANDPDCIRWFGDYRDYVLWNEHGNACSLSENGFEGFVQCILDPEDSLDYLTPYGPDDIPPLERDLVARLIALHQRYAPKTKSKNRRKR